jgi:hypothetical protein
MALIFICPRFLRRISGSGIEHFDKCVHRALRRLSALFIRAPVDDGAITLGAALAA